MVLFTKEQIPFLQFLDQDNADTVLQFINANDLSEEEKEECILSLTGEYFVGVYREWRNSVQPTQQITHGTHVEQFPFLAGVGSDAANMVAALLEDVSLEDNVRDDAICSMLEAQASTYLQWKHDRTAERFLSLLPGGIANHARKALAISNWKGAEMLMNTNAEAKRLFTEWMTEKAAIEAKKAKNKKFSNVVKVPSERIQFRTDGLPLLFNTKIPQWQKRFEVGLEKQECEGNTTIKVTGTPGKVLDCVIEIYGFMQKTMPLTQYLSPGQTNMIKNLWDLQKRISFMKKNLVDLWVTTENGYDVVKINAWTQEEMDVAKAKLCEEEKRYADGTSGPQPKKRDIPPTLKIDASKYPDVVNILVLGKSGVGKSTFINSLANYVFYENFEEAKAGQTHVFIKSRATVYRHGTPFPIFDEIIKPTVEGVEENATLGADSQTMRPDSYVMEVRLGKAVKKLRFIDTPGILDVRGPEQDRENMRIILQYLSHFENVHGVLILMDPDEHRINTLVRVTLGELLTRLHVDASRVINFGFVRAAQTNYMPGATSRRLQPLLEKVKNDHGVEIPLNRDTMYSFENNGFHVLSALKKGTQIPLEMEANAAKAWEFSAKETKRFLARILGLQPHQLEDMMGLNNVREVINCLAKPMTELAKQQLMNRRKIREKLEEIEMYKDEAMGLKGRLHLNWVSKKIVELDQPQTVCTSAKCTTYQTIGDSPDGPKWPIHNQVCHVNCHLTGVQEKKVNNPALKNCAAFQLHGIDRCHIDACGCDWTTHQHIRYRVETYETQIIDKNVANNAQTNEQLRSAAEDMVRTLRDREAALVRDNERIAQVGADFAVFLKNNSILSYNDAYLEYLEQAIKEENDRIREVGCSRQYLLELQKFKEFYQTTIQLIADGRGHAQDRPPLGIYEIRQLIEELMEHPEYGRFVREAHRTEVNGARDDALHEEKKISTEHPFTFMRN